MASFKDLMDTQDSTSQQNLVESDSENNPVLMATAYENENWQRSDKYLWYEEYTDLDYSTVDSDKNVNVNQKQISITQESNSQYIPFQMPRYYDGVDLLDKNILIHYVNSNGGEDNSSPINVTYNDEYIRFGWLVSKTATAIAGDLSFEIKAIGVTSKGDEYVFNTKPNGKINILKSLSGNGIIEPDESWITSFLTQVTEKVSEAQSAAQEATNAAAQANAKLAEVEGKITNVSSDITNQVLLNINETLLQYYTKTETDAIVSDLQDAIDSIDGLANFSVTYDNTTNLLTFKNGEEIICSYTLNTNPTQEWTNALTLSLNSYVDGKISEVSDGIESYKTEINETLGNINTTIEGISESVSTHNTEITNIKDELSNKASSSIVSALRADVDTVKSTSDNNKANIDAITGKITELEGKIGQGGDEPSLEYYATYDSETGQYILYEIEDGVETPKSQFTIVGGSGGGGSSTSTTVTIDRITTSPLITIKDSKVIIKYTFSSIDSSGEHTDVGEAVWKIGNTVIAKNIAVQGENSFDIGDYLTIGSNKVKLTITDEAGTIATKTWTIQIVDVKLESSFNDTLTYPLENISFNYIPYGAIEKTIHFILDGVELDSVTTPNSGIPMSYTLPSQEHGSHLLETYITANISGVEIETPHIFKDIIWYDSTSDIPVIGCVATNLNVKQYDSNNITYTVYDPKTDNPQVTLLVDNVVISNLTLDSPTQVWQFKSSEVGSHKLTIKCRDTIKDINVVVEKLDINVEPITAGLVFDFNPVGKSNNDVDRLWKYNDNIGMTVSDNFDWTNGGYQIDENGDQYFCIKAGTSATISYNLFADDARKNGKEFKLIFKTENVAKSNATFLSCLSDGIGLQMNVHEAYIKTNLKSLYVPYSEDDIIEWDFNIIKDSDIPIVMSYEDGTPCRPMSYTSDYSFTQDNIVPITIGSEDCDLRIYRMKAYNTSLPSRAVLSNYIADARTATEMIDRYNRNQIYDDNNILNPNTLAELMPDMRIIKIEAPYFTNDKKNYVKNTSMECIYKNGDTVLDNWKFENCYHAGQGTTSNEYGQAARNIDVICCADGINQINDKIPLDTEYKTKLTLGDGSVISDGTGKISLTRDSIPNNWWNFKVNVASSEMQNNATMQKRYNTYLPYSTPANRRDPRVKNDMEFVNCVIFIKENNPDISTHREFQDTEWHFYSLGNMGDSKKTDVTRAYDSTDMKEFCIEVSDNTLPNSFFQTGVINEDGTMKYPISKSEWISGNTAYDSLYNDWDGSFEFRYDCCGDSKDGSATTSDEEKEIIRANNRQIWRDFYEFVITSTDDEFVNDLKNWCIVDSALYFYLFTLRYTMIDNRAKNTFWHWAKHYISETEALDMGDEAKYYTIDNEAASINNGYRFDFWNYDNDTSLGINNSGELTMTYGKEDTDYREDDNPASGYIFNAAESVFFCRIRDLMNSELRKMYTTCESNNCWGASSLIKQFDDLQNEWCEELWILHYERLYERTYREGNTRFLEQMMNGKKKYQRRQFERDQEMYMATKFLGTTATSNQIMFRCNTPVEAVVEPNYTLHLTPYSDMYLSVMFGNSSPIQVRAKAGIKYDIECPYSTMDDTAVLIYGASKIQSIGDVSACYIHDNDFSKAEKLKELIIGNTIDGYSNPFLEKLVIGNNKLLERLDIRNTPKLSNSLDFSKCKNLTEFYAEGSGLTGVTFANGGKLELAHLPKTITTINMKNLIYLNDLSIEEHDSIIALVAENCNAVDVKSIIQNSNNLNRIRIIGIDWGLENTNILKRIYNMGGIDGNGYNTERAILSGKIHVPVIRQQELNEYSSAWYDLEITYDTLITQFAVQFLNDDGTVLDVQYVDKGESAVDPITREANPIEIPKKESTVSTDFTFSEWDSSLENIFANRTITALYSESVRNYTVKYKAKSYIKQETVAPYGSYVEYNGELPIYTDEEAGYKYYLFKGWDKSGYVDGDRVINAVYDEFLYTDGAFDNLDLSEMSEVQIYALRQIASNMTDPNKELTFLQNVVLAKDSFVINMKNDYSYSDIEETVLIEDAVVFNGSNYIDTGINLLDVDKDWTLVLDYNISSESDTNAVLMQCYQSNGSNGFRLSTSGSPKITWGTNSVSVSSTDKRDKLVLRHIKGENLIHVYDGNLPNEVISYSTLEASRNIVTNNQTLMFGCSKADDGMREKFAKGTIYWCKVWYTDLGDDICRSLVAWTNETITFEMTGAYKNYYLSDNPSKRCSMTFMASHVLGNLISFNSNGSTNGWNNSNLCNFLNSRFYSALPVTWKQILRQVSIPSITSSKDTTIVNTDCYISIPSLYEIGGSNYDTDPYNLEGTVFPFITSSSDRIRKNDKNEAQEYWTRTPYCDSSLSGSYRYFVGTDGNFSYYDWSNYQKGIVLTVSI